MKNLQAAFAQNTKSSAKNGTYPEGMDQRGYYELFKDGYDSHVRSNSPIDPVRKPTNRDLEVY